jgi:ribosomal protein L16/L10AE
MASPFQVSQKLRWKRPHLHQPTTLAGFRAASRVLRAPFPFTASIVAKQPSMVSGNSIEAFRKALRRRLKKRRTKIYINAFPFLPLTKKPLATRMGKGKGGKPRGIFSPLYPGKPIFTVFFRPRSSLASETPMFGRLLANYLCRVGQKFPFRSAPRPCYGRI